MGIKPLAKLAALEIRLAQANERIAALESALSPFAKVGVHTLDAKTPTQVFTWGNAPAVPKQAWVSAAKAMGQSLIRESLSGEVQSHE